MHTRHSGFEAEQIVKHYYQRAGWTFLVQNYTIRGGEVDLILKNSKYIVFVEVKSVNSRDSLMDYISYYKRLTLKKTIRTYLHMFPTTLIPRVDVVFVKYGKIFYHSEQCVDF